MEAKFIGVILVIGALIVIVNPTFESYIHSMTVDLRNVKWIISIFLFVAGALCIISGVRSQRPDRKVTYWICPECEKTTKLVGNKKHLCSECNVPLEKLEGFYD